jgi:6-phosphogluconate dehydrogenase
MLQPIFANYQKKDTMNLLFEPSIAKELKNGLPSLRNVVAQSVQGDHIVPALSASLEYIKYQTNTDLLTQFYEAELDFLGKHMFNKKGEQGTGAPLEGKHHFESKPAYVHTRHEECLKLIIAQQGLIHTWLHIVVVTSSL